MGPLGEIFNPGFRHEIEERQRKANRREEEGNARDGDDVRIDLESGVAVIDPAAAAAREQALEQERSDQERRSAAARRKAQRRAAAQTADPADPTDSSDDVAVSDTPSRPVTAPRTKADRNR